jgi:hypothetical protein
LASIIKRGSFLSLIQIKEKGIVIMKCTACGKEIADGSKFCPYCGANLNDAKEVVKPEVVGNDDAKKADETKKTDAAVAPSGTAKHSPAWVLALLSIILGALGSGLVGLVLGIIALCEKPTENEKTMAIVGIIVSVCLGWIWWGVRVWVR